MRAKIRQVIIDNVPEVNGRVFPMTLPQDTKLDSVVYRIIGDVGITGLSCNTPLTSRYAVQIDVLTQHYGDGVALAGKIKTALYDNFLTFNSNNYESYENITLKYRQTIDIALEEKYATI